MSNIKHHKVVVIGGGTGGIAVAAHLLKEVDGLDIAIVEPADKHYYQPGWTFVGGGVMRSWETERNMADVMPKKARWIQDRVASIDAQNNALTLASGATVTYDFLIVAAGIKILWEAIPGLKEGLGKNGVVSNYDFTVAPLTWKAISEFKGGTAIFTQPPAPFKCPGAAQKILYLADDTFRKNKVREKSKLIFCSAGPGIFPVKKYAATLNQVIKRKGLDVRYQTKLVELRPEAKEAVFEANNERQTLSYDMIHVTPPMGAPDFIKSNNLCDAAGWLDVNMHTLQHKQYKNIFGLGDCTNTPNSKTAAAIRAQTPVLVSNLILTMAGQEGKAAYDGYASCPLITGYGKLVLAEFDYNMMPKETFPFDQGKERRSMYLLKKYVLPKFYWNILLKGGDISLSGS